MSKPFDATIKALLRYPRDWLQQLGLRVQGEVTEVSVDLSTVSAAADTVFQIQEGSGWLLHLEIQTGPDATLPGRILKYNGLLYERFSQPVHTVVILLRRQAELASVNGTLQYRARPELGGLHLQYAVARIWEWPLEALLGGGLGTLPLAPLSAEVTEDNLPTVIHRMDERFQHEADGADTNALWTATYVLLGLRFPGGIAKQVMKGVKSMKDSVTYQAIVEEGREKGLIEGRVEGRVEALLRLGRIRWGDPKEAQRQDLERIVDIDRLERMTERLLQAGSWQELLETP